MTPVPARAITIVTIEDQLIATGDIGAPDCDAMRRQLHDHSGVHTVVLRNMRGGDAQLAMCFGNLITAHHLNTAVSGYCESACTYAFMAGADRRFADDYPATRTWLGLQGFYDGDGVLLANNLYELEAWIERQTNRRLDTELVSYWLSLDNPSRMVYVFRVSPLRPNSDDDVALCDRKDATTSKCSVITGTTALSNHIITTADTITSHDLDPVQAEGNKP